MFEWWYWLGVLWYCSYLWYQHKATPAFLISDISRPPHLDWRWKFPWQQSRLPQLGENPTVRRCLKIRSNSVRKSIDHRRRWYYDHSRLAHTGQILEIALEYMNHNKEARVTDVIWRINWQGTVVKAKHHIWIISQIFLDNISLLNSKMGPRKFSFIWYLDPLIIVTDCQKHNLVFIIIVFFSIKCL